MPITAKAARAAVVAARAAALQTEAEHGPHSPLTITAWAALDAALDAWTLTQASAISRQMAVAA